MEKLIEEGDDAVDDEDKEEGGVEVAKEAGKDNKEEEVVGFGGGDHSVGFEEGEFDFGKVSFQRLDNFIHQNIIISKDYLFIYDTNLVSCLIFHYV